MLLFAIAFPPYPLILPAFLCLVPFAVAIARRADGAGSWREAARLGFWFGMLGYAANLYWIAIALLIFTKLAIVGYIAALSCSRPWSPWQGSVCSCCVARRSCPWRCCCR